MKRILVGFCVLLSVLLSSCSSLSAKISHTEGTIPANANRENFSNVIIPQNIAPNQKQQSKTENLLSNDVRPEELVSSGIQLGKNDGDVKIPFTFLFFHGLAWLQEDLFEKLPKGFVEEAVILQNNDFHVPQEELTSCRLSPGMKVFTSDKYKRAVFVEREDGKYILFWPYTGQILNYEPDYNEYDTFPNGEIGRCFLSYRGELWTDYGMVDSLPDHYGDYYLKINHNYNSRLPDPNESLFSSQLKEGSLVFFSKLEPDVIYVEREEGGFLSFLPYRADASAWVPRP